MLMKKLFHLSVFALHNFFVHGFLPSSLLTVVLVPIVKNKAGNINSIDNYRPVALSNIFSKILETIILGRIDHF